LSEDDLQCGCHYPLHPKASIPMKSAGQKATTLHNNCSGKHGGMLLACLAAADPIESYLDPQHPRQMAMKQMFATFAEVSADSLGVYVDGCSAPTFSTTLVAAATAFRNFGRPPVALGTKVQEAAARLKTALRAHPFLLGGSARFCTDLVIATEGRVLGKVGAAGFYGAFCEESGRGVALHVDDGNSDVAEGLMGRLLHHMGWITDKELSLLDRYCGVVRRNHRGLDVGRSETVFAPIGRLESRPKE
jgi:L-asparaginase II